MFSIQQPLLVFSDLDGTLLDSHSYDWQPAAPWLSRLREANVPVILCSSKTSAEMLYLQKTLGLQGLPLIAENGAVIQLAEQWQDIDGFPRIISGISHGEISQVLNTFDFPGVLVAMLFELGYSITQRGEIQWRYESFAHAITQKDQFVDVILQMLIERVGYVFQMITLAGDIGIFQHHYFTPGEQGGKKQYHDKAEINDMTRPQAACEFFQPALVFHFCLVLHPDDSQPAFL